MNFCELLHYAQRNLPSQGQNSSTSRNDTIKIVPPKREGKQKTLSDNIKKFLAKREQEDREKEQEERKRREELSAKRDPKAKRKIEKMLKVIRSANKSVLDDAIDHKNTAVTLQGPEQPDDDDYGYTSNVASQFYQQLMEKYNATPVEKKFTDGQKRTMTKEDMDRAKDRVKDALLKAHEDEMAPRTRKPRAKGAEAGGSEQPERSEPAVERKAKEPQVPKEPEKKQKPKRSSGPPPPDFKSLMKLAEQKQFEPMVEPRKPVETKKIPERLMTKKQKREHEEQVTMLQMRKIREKIRDDPKLSDKEKQLKLDKLAMVRAAGKNPSAPSPTANRYPSKPVSTDQKPSIPPKIAASTNEKSPTSTVTRPDPGPISKSQSFKTPAKPKSTGEKVPEKPAAKAPPVLPSTAIRAKSSPVPSNPKPNAHGPSKANPKDSPSAGSPRKPPPTPVTSSKATPALSSSRPATKSSPHQVPASPSAQKTRPFPPPDTIKSRPFPPPDVQRGRQLPSARPRSGGAGPPSSKKRRVIQDSDSEYDSEMDDFIDDGDCGEDYSTAIREIFGYDKSRYRDEDYDDRRMESTFAQQMREEYISKKIGIMEDLEDMKMEEEEKLRKQQAKKKSRK